MGAVSLLEMTNTPQPKNTDLPRPLNQDERELLVHVLKKFIANAEKYLQQLGNSVVVGKCLCGCPTIDLWKVGEEEPPGERARVFWGGNGTNAAGELLGLLLFQTDGVLSGLEIIPYGDERDCGMPRLDSIEELPLPPDCKQ
jgi:hypothetical protein